MTMLSICLEGGEKLTQWNRWLTKIDNVSSLGLYRIVRNEDRYSWIWVSLKEWVVVSYDSKWVLISVSFGDYVELRLCKKRKAKKHASVINSNKSHASAPRPAHCSRRRATVIESLGVKEGSWELRRSTCQCQRLKTRVPWYPRTHLYCRSSTTNQRVYIIGTGELWMK